LMPIFANTALIMVELSVSKTRYILQICRLHHKDISRDYKDHTPQCKYINDAASAR
jgi:hypothetical protein